MNESSFLEYIIEELSSIGQISHRRLFRSRGLYFNGDIFGIISQGTLYLKIDQKTEQEYNFQNLRPFSLQNKRILKHYLEIPADIIDDGQALRELVRKIVH